MSDADLERAFENDAVSGGVAGCKAGIDGSQFAKLCREAGLLNRSLNCTHVDLIFAKTSNKARCLNYSKFKKALYLLAEARQCSGQDIMLAITAYSGLLHNQPTPNQG